MCGIAGQLQFPSADLEVVRRMTGALAHRGPDGDGLFEEGPVALGHRRLSIIDLDGGGQPFLLPSCQLAVTFNGEIYNYRELTRELCANHTFRSRSDTEVLLHLYEEFGDAMVGKLQGMFSFALWDGRKQRLLCARDRFGEKPFYYATHRGGLTFASELRAFERAGLELGSLDRGALSDYLELLYIPAPRTIWRGIHKLPAGHLLVADREGVRVERYWDLPVSGSGSAPEDLPARFRSALEASVRAQLNSDVPVGALLSGGLDSSTVVALMSRLSAGKVKTFSVGFGRDDDELPYARLVSQRYGTEHHELQVQSSAVEQTLEAIEAYSEPFGDSSAVPTIAVCKEVSHHVKVVLTGDGGDELFAGYGRYRQVSQLPYVGAARLAAGVLERLPVTRRRSQARRALETIGHRRARRYRALIEVFPRHLRSALLGTDARTAPLGPDLDSDADSAIAFDLQTYLPDDLLTKVDIAAMRWGLESRCPMLDPTLAELTVPCPEAIKQDRTAGKLLLKNLARDLLPPELIDRPKRGFGSPVEAWLRGPLRSLVGDLLLSPDCGLRDQLDEVALRGITTDAFDGRGNAHQAWALLAFELWSRKSKSERASL